MANNSFYLHIGESSWDAQCLRHVGIDVQKSFLHNDYFQKSVSKNYRVLKTVKIFFLVFIAFLKNKRIIFSSINSDSMLVQLFFCFYNKCYFFIPNVCGYKMEQHIGAKIYRFLIQSYSTRVIVSDEVTHHCLRHFNPTPVSKLFSLSRLSELPKKNLSNFIVVLPTPETHKDSLNDSDFLYDFHLKVFNFFHSRNIRVFLLIHPRDRGDTIRNLKKNNIPLGSILDSNKIADLENVVYVSGFSSLCLNKRYGGSYGIWVSLERKNILKDEFKDCEKFLIDIEDLT